MINVLKNKIEQWLPDENAIAAAEFGIVFPIMFTMLIGVWDLGNGILVNQKAIAASQIVIDLICREESISDDELAQAFKAGELAMMPFDTSSLEIDVLSAQYDEDDLPVALWQETSAGAEDSGLVDKAVGLGTDGDGVVAVEVRYTYEPLFSGTVIGTIHMKERVFSRGRQSTTVARDS